VPTELRTTDKIGAFAGVSGRTVEKIAKVRRKNFAGRMRLPGADFQGLGASRALRPPLVIRTGLQIAFTLGE